MQAAVISGSTAPQPATGGKKPNLMEMLNTTSVPTPANAGYGQPQQQPVGYGIGGMGMGGNMGVGGGGMGIGGSMGLGGGSMGMIGMNMGGHRQTPSLSSNTSQFSTPQLQPQQSNLFGGGSAPMRAATMGGSLTSMSNSSAKPPPAAQTKSANFDDLWSMSLGSGGSSTTKSGATTAGKSIKDIEKEKAMAGIWGAQQKPTVGGGAAPATFGGFGTATPSSSGADDLLL